MTGRFTVLTALALCVGFATASESMPSRLKIGVEVVKRAGGGVKVTKVYDDSPAKEIGLRPGIILVEVDGRPANDPLKLQDYVLGKQEADETFRLVYRDGPKFFAVEIEIVTEEREYSATGPGRRRTRTELVKRWKVLSREEIPPPK